MRNVCSVGQAIRGLVSSPPSSIDSLFEFRIADTINQFQKDWDSIVPEQSIIHSKTCQVYERTSGSTIYYRYVLAYYQNKPVLATCFQLIRISSNNIHKTIENEFLRFATNAFLNLHDLRLLVTGNVFREESATQYCISLLPDGQTRELQNFLLEAVRNKESAAAILWKEMPAEFIPQSKSLKLDEDISMAMEIRNSWTKWEDYLKDLTKKYAARAKKILASVQDMHVQELSLEEIEANKAALQRLYEQVIQKQGFVFGTLTENYWPAQKALHGDQFSIKALYLKDQLVAFISAFNQPDELEIHYVGIDYEMNQNYPLYFYLHFVALQEAINSKKRRLLMGRTSLEAKAILGCVPVFHRSFVQFHHSILECAYGAVRKSMIETENWKTRNPLRTNEPHPTLQEL